MTYVFFSFQFRVTVQVYRVGAIIFFIRRVAFAIKYIIGGYVYQRGAPTYAADLAEAVMKIVSVLETKNQASPAYGGIYHFSNEGNISWYDFAIAIKELSGSSCIVNPIPTSEFPTPAKRPFYSVLDKTKIQSRFGIEINDWKQSLATCIERIKQTS